MSVNSKMTALADKIRVLSGTEETMGLDDMAIHVGEANENVDTEASLISQIAAALEGKAGGSESNNTVQTCTVTSEANVFGEVCYIEANTHFPMVVPLRSDMNLTIPMNSFIGIYNMNSSKKIAVNDAICKAQSTDGTLSIYYVTNDCKIVTE